MKLWVLRFLALFCLIIDGGSANSATINWTNIAGGDWNATTNWSPNQVPVSGDDVVVTNAGTYAVTNTGSITLDSLVLGGTNGIQTLTIASLTLTNGGVVNSNGVLNWAGGNLERSLTVAQGGTLTISNSVTFSLNNPSFGYTNTSTLTNNGTVIWAGNATSYGNNQAVPNSGGAVIYNAGLWDAVGDNTLGLSANSSNVFINAGTLEKTGGIGASTVNWHFASSGTINTTSGTFTLNWDSPSTLHGNLTVSSTTITTSLNVASNAVLNLSGGDLEGSLTVAQGGTLSLSNAVTFALNNASQGHTNITTVTNNGTVIWAGNATSYGNNQPLPNSGGTVIYNAGLWDAVGDNTLGVSANSSNTFVNTGTVAKIGGAGVSSINWGFLNNGGTLNTPVGAFSIGNWTGSGVVHGTATFSGGTVSGTLAAGALMNFSATINAALTVSSNAVANWGGGDLEGSLTVAQGGTLSISNNVTFSLNNPNFGITNISTLTNSGTVIWACNATSYGNNQAIPNSGGAVIYNAGLWEAVADNTLGISANSSNVFINVGTLEKIGGTGASTINWNFSSTGILLTTSGVFTLNWNGPSTLNGNLTLSSATVNAPIIVASNAVLNLSGGDLESSLTVAQGGTLSLSNGVSFAQNNSNLGHTNITTLTNNGTVIWAGNSTSYGNSQAIPNSGGTVIYNAGLWEAVGDNTLAMSGNSSNLFINAGTLEKIGGTGASTIGWGFESDGGLLETPVGNFTFSLIWRSNSVVFGNAAVTGPIAGVIGSNAVLNWFSSDLENALTVAQGGTLSLSNNMTFSVNNANLGITNISTLTNYGTVIWACNATSYGNNQAIPNSGGTIVYNAGLWEAVADNTLSMSANSSNLFINAGTLEKIGGIGTSTINWSFRNSGGVLGSQTNTISLSGSYDLTGGTVNSGINSPGNNGIINLSGSPAALTGAFSANLNNGYVPATGSAFSVVTYSSRSGNFTNFNLPFPDAWQTNYGSTAFTLTVLNVRPTLAAIANHTVDELTLLTVTNGATDPDVGQTLTFALVSAPGGMTINTNSGTMSWTPAQTQSPSTNAVFVSVTDNGTPPLSATNSFTATVREVNVPPSLPTVSTQTVNELTLLTVTNAASNFNIHSTIIGYTLVSPPSNMVISAAGVVTWTPAQPQSPGTNVITTIVTNSNPYDLINPRLTSTNQFTVIVKEVNVAPTLPAVPTQTVNELTLLTVTNAASNFNIHSIIVGYTLVSPPSNMVISAAGVVTWTPAQPQSPSTNVITTITTNSNPFDLVNPRLTATNTFTVIVKEVNVAPVLSAISIQTITLLKPSFITNSATEPNIHSVTSGYLLLSPPPGAAVDSSGVITWTPAQNRALTTNTITTVVTNSNPFDLVNPHLGSTNSFSVIVVPSTVVTNISMVNSSGTNLTLSWPADHTGWRLQIQTNALTNGISTNWATYPGSTGTNVENIPIVLTNDTVFFRMVYP